MATITDFVSYEFCYPLSILQRLDRREMYGNGEGDQDWTDKYGKKAIHPVNNTASQFAEVAQY